MGGFPFVKRCKTSWQGGCDVMVVTIHDEGFGYGSFSEL